MQEPMEPVYGEFGRQVRRRRTALGWSQERLGKALRPSMTRASIANIEAGHQRVLLHTALSLSIELEVGLDELLNQGSSVGMNKPDPEALAAELESKLPISSVRARSLASRVSRKNGGANT